MESALDRLIYDWNRDGRAARADYRAVELDDETLRDGLQGPSVRNPPLDVKKRLLSLMDQLGIDSADIGLPGASPQARASIVALRSEERRVGEECRSRWLAGQYNKEGGRRGASGGRRVSGCYDAGVGGT